MAGWVPSAIFGAVDVQVSATNHEITPSSVYWSRDNRGGQIPSHVAGF